MSRRCCSGSNPPRGTSSKRPRPEMVSGASKRAPALEMSPMPERIWCSSTTSWSAPSMRSIRGARWRNAASMRVVQRSGGSKTCESDERMRAGSMGMSFPFPRRLADRNRSPRVLDRAGAAPQYRLAGPRDTRPARSREIGRTQRRDVAMAIVGTGKYRYELIENWAKLPAGQTLGNTSAVATDSRDRVYVFQRKDPPVLVFERDGTYLSCWGIGAFADPHGIYIADDVVY